MNSEPVPIQRSNSQAYKEHHSDVHDPILSAVHEAQPFEESMTQSNHYRTVSSPDTHFRDIFGNPIAQPDRSNPTRPRDERPLDTIRSFEYSCTGDDRIRDEMETPRLGWGMRSGFQSTAGMPQFDSNPYQQQQNNNVISFDQNTYTRNEPTPVAAAPAAAPQKKKRGLFGRKKK